MKTDDICRTFASKAVRLSLRLLEPTDDDESPLVLIEGNSQALRMLAELIGAVAEASTDDGFSLSPHGAGKRYFATGSTHGFYINRID